MNNSNPFNIENPSLIRCHVWSYERPLIARLILKLEKPTSKVLRWIFFEDVDYFSGSMAWAGANFTIASRQEQEQLRMRMGQKDIPEKSMNILLDNYMLYVVKPTNQELPIKILARKAFTSSIQYTDSDFFARQ